MENLLILVLMLMFAYVSVYERKVLDGNLIKSCIASGCACGLFIALLVNLLLG